MYDIYTLNSPDLHQLDQTSPCLLCLGGKVELIPPSVPSEDGQQPAVLLEAFSPPNLHHLQSYTVLKISTGKYIFINPKTMTQLRKTTTQVEGHRLTLTQVNVSKRTTANLSAQPVFVPHSKLHGLVVLRKEMQKKNTKSEQKLELNQCPTEDCEVNPSAIPRACPRGWTQLLNL